MHVTTCLVLHRSYAHDHRPIEPVSKANNLLPTTPPAGGDVGREPDISINVEGEIISVVGEIVPKGSGRYQKLGRACSRAVRRNRDASKDRRREAVGEVKV